LAVEKVSVRVVDSVVVMVRAVVREKVGVNLLATDIKQYVWRFLIHKLNT